jgi:hypothetical protein
MISVVVALSLLSQLLPGKTSQYAASSISFFVAPRDLRISSIIIRATFNVST